MTRNYAESFNGKSRRAKRYPITTLVDFWRFTLQDWFCKQRELVDKCNGPLSPDIENNLHKSFDVASSLIVHPLSQFDFFVQDGEKDNEVNLQTKTCTCKVFDLMIIPCLHVLVVA